MDNSNKTHPSFPRLICLFVICAAIVPGIGAKGSAQTMEEVISGAKKEGRVRVGITLRRREGGKPAATRLIEAFQKRYPYIKVDYHRIGGSRERERVFSEMAGGMVDYDVATLSQTHVLNGIKADIFRLVKWEALGVRSDDIHPKNVGITFRSQVWGIGFNTDLLSRDVGRRLTWEEFVEPKWRGKFAIDDRPRHLEVLYQDNAWGREKTLDYARRLAANNPLQERSRSEATFKLTAGAFPSLHGSDWGHIRRQQVAGSTNLDITFPEPVTLSAGDLVFIPRGAKYPNAAMLWIVWSLGDEAQRIIDDVQFTGDPLSPASSVHERIRGKKVVEASWDYQLRATDILKEIIQAMGFPVVR